MTTINVKEIIFNTHTDAEITLARMDQIVKDYDVVRVADLYDLVGYTTEYTDNHYFWNQSMLNEANILRVRDGYIIELPKPISDGHTRGKVTYRDYSQNLIHKSIHKSIPKSVNILVNTDGFEDVEDILNSLFRSLNTISDRDVHITIM